LAAYPAGNAAALHSLLLGQPEAVRNLAECLSFDQTALIGSSPGVNEEADSSSEGEYEGCNKYHPES
jgi:hypothetical protein